MDLVEHLFRDESGRLVAALTRILGVRNLALAEDVVQEAFARAHEVWRIRGVPDNPSAWLLTTARRLAIDVVRRERTAVKFAPEVARLLESEWTLAPAVAEVFEAHTIRDAQLRMMFTCCHPQLAEEAQIALILNVLCGFGTAEIAQALLKSQVAIEKRITRAKKALAEADGLFDLTDKDFVERLENVRHALYLLFNEGFHGASTETPVQSELCREAMRLTALLQEYPPAATPATLALLSLMCLHAARLPARLDPGGDLTVLTAQDRTRWDSRLLTEGLVLFEQSASGADLSRYHLEAALAAAHTTAGSFEGTDWDLIIALYDRLMDLQPSPVFALNRAIALGFRDGPDAGLVALRAIAERDRLANYPFYPAAAAELELRRGATEAARHGFLDALALARSPAERRFLERRLQVLTQDPTKDSKEPPSMPVALTKARADVLGHRMAYVDVGQGDPIVFLHGNPTSSYIWRQVLPHLSGLGRCIAPDLIGMGDSDKLPNSGPQSYTFVEHRRYLDALLATLGVEDRVTLVVHDWGSALGFDWANRHRSAVRGIAYMEAIVRPISWAEFPAQAKPFFEALRSPAGEKLVLEQNAFVEAVLPTASLRPLVTKDLDEYRRPFVRHGEGRRPTLTWPRQIPIEGEPADVAAIVTAYGGWLATSEIPKLFVRADPGTMAQTAIEFCRTWRAQEEVTVPGGHLLQEDSPFEIGRALATWLSHLA